MKKFLKGIVSTTKSLGKMFENYSLLVDKGWFLISADHNENKTTYIFRSKADELLISNNGVIEKGKWEYIKTSNCLLLEIKGVAKLYQVLYIREHYLIFQNDFDPVQFVFVNESQYRNKYANEGAKILDIILNDIGDGRFNLIQLPKTIATTSPIKPETHIEHNPIVKENKEVSKAEEIKYVAKDIQNSSLDDNIKRIDDIIKNLEKFTKK